MAENQRQQWNNSWFLPAAVVKPRLSCSPNSQPRGHMPPSSETEQCGTPGKSKTLKYRSRLSGITIGRDEQIWEFKKTNKGWWRWKNKVKQADDLGWLSTKGFMGRPGINSLGWGESLKVPDKIFHGTSYIKYSWDLLILKKLSTIYLKFKFNSASYAFIC